MIPRLLLALALFCVACGGSGDANGETTSGDDSVSSEDMGDAPASSHDSNAEQPGDGAEEPGGEDVASGDCAYQPGDSCITEENLAQCREMSAQCPGRVVALESCPLQFACE